MAEETRVSSKTVFSLQGPLDDARLFVIQDAVFLVFDGGHRCELMVLDRAAALSLLALAGDMVGRFDEMEANASRSAAAEG